YLAPASGGALTINAAGSIETTPVAGVSLPDPFATLGGSVILSGARVDSGAEILARSGSVTLEATETSAAGRVAVGGRIDVSGLDRVGFGPTTISSAGGSVTLRSAGAGATAGDAAVRIGAGAEIDVSGGDGQSPRAGGTLTLLAPDGAVTLAGGAVLSGRADASARGAELRVDAARVIGGVAGMMAAVEAPDNFTGLREVAVDSGDIVFDGGQAVTASRLAFTTDGGTIRVGDALLDARGWWGGDIRLNAGSAVELGAGARLLASAGGGFRRPDGAVFEDGLPGGIVTLAAATGSLSLEAGASIDVAGTQATALGGLARADTGRVRLVAARSGNAPDITAPLAATIAGAGTNAIELIAHDGYTSGTIAGAVADGAALTGAEAATLAALGVGGDGRFRVAPGVELAVAGGTLSAAGVNAGLLTNLFDAGSINAGMFTVRSGGALELDLDVRDGLVSVFAPEFTSGFLAPPRVEYLVADDAASWTLQFVAGADAASADLLARNGGADDLTVKAGVDVITGSGDIQLAASGDIVLEDNANVFIAGRHADLATYTGTISPVVGPTEGNFFARIAQSPAARVIPGASFPDFGGDLHLSAGGSLTTEAAGQFVSEWMTRTGIADGAVAADLAAQDVAALEVMPSAWGVFIDRVRSGFTPVDDGDDRGFNQGFAAFGGGGIFVDVGGDVTNATFSVPTVGRQVGTNTFGDANRTDVPELAGSTTARWLDVLDDADDYTDVIDEIGGGQVHVRAGGAVTDVDLVVFRGEASISGGESVTLNRVAVGNATVSASAGSGLEVNGVVDPQLLDEDNVGAFGARNAEDSNVYVTGRTRQRLETAFFSYGADATLDLATAAGDLVLGNDGSLFNTSTTATQPDNIFPGDVSLLAPGGRVSGSGTVVMFPAARGTLRARAGEDIRSTVGTVSSLAFLQSDFDAGLLPSRGAAIDRVNVEELTEFDFPVESGLFGEPGHAASPVHAGDRVPNEVVARSGNLVELGLRLSKQSVVAAGKDIDSVDVVIQHPNESDLSLVEAGRDIRFDLTRLSTGVISLDTAPEGLPAAREAKIAVGGPGTLQVIAGRDINLGALDGIKAFGDESNPSLSDRGADLLIFAGVATAPDYVDFTTRFLDPEGNDLPAGAATPAEIGEEALVRIQQRYDPETTLADLEIDDDTLAQIQAELVTYLDTLERDGAASLDPGLSPVGQFRNNLSELQQRGFLLDVFFNELQASSFEAADPASGRLNDFVRGRQAIAILFPAEAYDGDVVSALSAVQTLDGGDIRVLAPGGTVDAGTTAQTSVEKQPLNLGYVAFREGSIGIFTGDSINVNSTRIFTQKGGDITLWADRGNIDAGRGQRDAVTLANTQPVFDEFLNFVDEPPISVSGSGIRTLAPPGIPGGSIFLAAPEGTIDAGDAGIESDSGLVLAAQEVANADFIAAAGPTFSTVQVPTSVGASLGNLGDVSAAATASVTEATQAAAAAAAEQSAAAAAGDAAPPMRVTVDVLGFGS
ncbi:MAG: filamentous hemagglutinin family protein, partial [Gammaproteobacteria bacterium]